LYQWLFDLVPKWASILIVTINMVLVYIFVRNQEIVSERWIMSTSSQKTSRKISLNNNNSMNASSAEENSSNMNQSQGNNNWRIAITRGGRRSWWRQQHQVLKRVSFSRQIAQQSYLYVGALWITWLPAIVLRGVQLASGVTYYWLLVWLSLSIPMQGFWNVLVYLRPRWLQKRREQFEKQLDAERRGADEPISHGRGALSGKAAMRVATYLKELSIAAVDALIEGDIPEVEARETDSNPHEFIEEGKVDAGRESV